MIIHMRLQIGTGLFVLELGPSSPHKEYLPSSDNCVEMSGGNVLKTKGNFHMGTQTHCLYVCANVHFMKLSGLFFAGTLVGKEKHQKYSRWPSQCILSNSCPKNPVDVSFQKWWIKVAGSFLKTIDMSIIFRTLHQDLHSRAKKLILVQIFEKNHSKPYLRATVTIFPQGQTY